MRLVMKPGDSRMSTVSLPISRATSSITAKVSGVVSRARTISTSFILWTGLKKCMPPMRPGFVSTAASSVMLSAEVFEAMTAPAGAEASTAQSSAILSSAFSGAASIDHIGPGHGVGDAGRGREPVERRVAVVLGVSFPRSTPFFRIDITWPTAMLSCVCEMSYRRVV